MKKIGYLLLALFILLFISACSESDSGGSDSDLSNFAIGAGTTGGGMNNAATAITNVINEKIDGMESSVQVVGGAVDNAKLLQNDELKLGLSTTEVVWEAYNGEMQFENEEPYEDLRAMFPAYRSIYMIFKFTVYPI